MMTAGKDVCQLSSCFASNQPKCMRDCCHRWNTVSLGIYYYYKFHKVFGDANVWRQCVWLAGRWRVGVVEVSAHGRCTENYCGGVDWGHSSIFNRLNLPQRPGFISERELTFTFAICYRPSVCLSVCRLSVMFVRPTQAVQIFGNISMASGTLAIHWHSLKILRRSS